jgi:hypothetical protein
MTQSVMAEMFAKGKSFETTTAGSPEYGGMEGMEAGLHFQSKGNLRFTLKSKSLKSKHSMRKEKMQTCLHTLHASILRRGRKRKIMTQSVMSEWFAEGESFETTRTPFDPASILMEGQTQAKPRRPRETRSRTRKQCTEKGDLFNKTEATL